jgi:hypothetical protein
VISKNQKFIINKGYRKLVSLVIRRIYQDNVKDLGSSIFVVGSARSGTTWLANLIASQFRSRIMFEPFNPILVKEFSKFNYFQYMRPNEFDQALYNFCHKVFTGNIRNAWIDREIQYLFPQGRVIKCIRSSLMLKWLDIQFPQVPKFFVIRHPCAVVQSRMKLEWATDDDIRHFLIQPTLMEDFLNDKIDVIEKAKTEEQKHAVIWCVTNLVPIKQFPRENINIVLYENLVQFPLDEIAKIFKGLKISYNDSIFNKLKQPSLTTTHTSAILTGKGLTGHWKNDLSLRQIDNILEVVDKFGLTWIYENLKVSSTKDP